MSVRGHLVRSFPCQYRAHNQCDCSSICHHFTNRGAEVYGEIAVAPWPAPDPATRVIVHGCDWVECTNHGVHRHGYWGQYHWLCEEHGDLLGDDGSMDDTYDDDERPGAMKRAGL